MAGDSDWGWALASTLLALAWIFDNAHGDVVVLSDGYVSYTQKLTSSALNTFQVQFRTKDHTGILMHAKGGTDNVTLELIRGRLRYAANFGQIYDSYEEIASGFHELFVGQNLADSEWHNVVLIHNEKEEKISIKVDNLKDVEFEATRTLAPKSVKLSIEYVQTGGMKFVEGVSSMESLSQRGISGCFRKTTYNGKSVIQGSQVTLVNAKSGACQLKSFSNLIDFPLRNSYVSYNYTNGPMLVSFSFKTSQHSQLLFETESKALPDLKLRIAEDGRLVSASGKTRLYSLVGGTQDGYWHDVEFSWSSTPPFKMMLKVDGNASSMDMPKGFPSTAAVEKIFFGKDFQGCMRSIEVSGKQLASLDFDLHGPSAKWKPTFGMCAQIEFCTPNPCLNGGKCKEVYGLKDYPRGTFECDCTNTGYSGSVCNKPLYSKSCAARKAESAAAVNGKAFIDVDGLGPLPKTEVECLYGIDGVTTVVNTKLSSEVAVENPFGLKRIDIPYSADTRSLKTITAESGGCQQHVKYVCTKSALFQSPKGPPQVRWVGPDHRFHYYWGGSNGRTDYCLCGVYGNCTDKSKYCNCDARSAKEAKDEGALTNKKHLPMTIIEFLDANSGHGSKGRFSVGALKCRGDVSKDNAVSFRDSMASIEIKPTSVTDYNNAIDAMTVSLSFKTTQAEGVILYGKGKVSQDYVMIKIQSRNLLRAEINLGSKADFADVNIKGQFDDDKSHSVFMEFNRKEISLTVDGISASSKRDPTSMFYLDLEGESMRLGGGTDKAQGFTGCIQGLFINGLMIDMQSTAKYMENHGVYLGCGIGCNRPSLMPCNYGKCIEKYTSYTCDCSMSPFDGKHCHKESYPVKFTKDASLMYTFKTPVQIKKGEVVVAFKTDSKNGLIFSIHGDKQNCHLSLVIVKGSLKVAYNFKTSSVSSKFLDVETASRKYRFDDGKLYSLRISHNKKKVTVQMLDGKSEETFQALESGEELLTGVKISIASVKPPLSPQASLPNSFAGCMSSFKYKYLPNMKKKPVFIDLFALFSSGSPDVGGKGSLGPCGKSLPTPPPLPFLMGRPTTPTKYDKTPARRSTKSRLDYSIIIIAVACGVALLLLIIIVIFCKHINRNLGAYRTHEDKRPVFGHTETSFSPQQDSADGKEASEGPSKSKGTKKPEVFV